METKALGAPYSAACLKKQPLLHHVSVYYSGPDLRIMKFVTDIRDHQGQHSNKSHHSHYTTPCSGTSPPFINTSKDGDFNASLRSLFQCSATLSVRKFFPNIQPDPPLVQLVAISSILSNAKFCAHLSVSLRAGIQLHCSHMLQRSHILG